MENHSLRWTNEMWRSRWTGRCLYVFLCGQPSFCKADGFRVVWMKLFFQVLARLNGYGFAIVEKDF